MRTSSSNTKEEQGCSHGGARSGSGRASSKPRTVYRFLFMAVLLLSTNSFLYFLYHTTGRNTNTRDSFSAPRHQDADLPFLSPLAIQNLVMESLSARSAHQQRSKRPQQESQSIRESSTHSTTSTTAKSRKDQLLAPDNIYDGQIKPSSQKHHSTKNSNTTMRPPNQKEDPPPVKRTQFNIMIFYPDDWRHDTIGAAGTQPVRTPFLDQLAREGIRFTQNAVTTSICWISRATKLTGQYLSRHGATWLKTPTFYDRWNETFPYLLQQQAGYFVGHIGKWQYQDKSDFVRHQYNWTKLYGGSHWYNVKGVNVHSTTLDEENSVRFLRERPRDVPFCLTTAFYAPKAVGDSTVDQYFPMNETEHLYDGVDIPLPHDPEESFRKLPQFMQDNWYYLEGRRRYAQRYDVNVTGQYQKFMTKYYRLVSEVDRAIERVVDELKEQGILDETIIVFTTDNGLFHGEHGLAGKWFPHQESIRVPLIIRDPRMDTSRVGTLDDSLTLNIDLAPTILGAAGLATPSYMQGRDISDLYLKTDDAKETWRKDFFYEHPTMQFKKGIPESSAVVRKDFKYIRWPQYDYEQLFDLQSDPLELQDLARMRNYSKVLSELRARHLVLKKEIQ